MYQDFNDYENFVPLQPLDNMTRGCGCSQQQGSNWNPNNMQNTGNQMMPSPMNMPMNMMPMNTMPMQPNVMNMMGTPQQNMMGMPQQQVMPGTVIDQLTGINSPLSASGEQFVQDQDQQVLDDINYTQGYLRSKIGRYVKIEFLIGTDMWVDREGILTSVGISYVVLTEADTRLELMCDIYSIRFVRIANVAPINPLAPNASP